MRRQYRQTFLVGVAILLLATPLFSQPDTLWTKTYGGSEWEQAWSVQQTSDGGYIVAGYTSSFGAGEDDVWLLKTDANGDTLWTRTYGGEGDDRGSEIQQTSDGGYIITGWTTSFGAGEEDVYLIKTDADGDTLWTKTYGSADIEEGYCVQPTSDDGYIIAGLSLSFDGGLLDAYLVKTDADGNHLWTKEYGGDESDAAYCICETSDGGYIITGFTESFGAGRDDVWLLKTDENGDTLWTRTYGGEDYEIGWSVCETSDGGYVIAGWTESFAVGFWDVYLIKTDADGDTQWTKTWGGMHIDVIISVQETPAGGYILAGHTYLSDEGDEHSDIYLIRTDPNGDSLWSRTWGGTSNEYGLSICLTSDGGYAVAGATSSFGAGGYDVWLLKIAPEIGVKEVVQEPIFVTQVAPNPFSEKTLIGYQLPKSGNVQIAVCDPIGRIVNTLVDGYQNAGIHTVTWDGSDKAGKKISAGVYFIKVEVGEERYTGKVVLMR